MVENPSQVHAIIFYQHKVRELSACRRLKDHLEKLPIFRNAIIEIFQIDFEWMRAVRFAKHGGIDLIVMPWLYHDNNYALLDPFLAINPSAVIVNLHHEQITSPAFEANTLPTTEHTKNGCYHLCWGEAFKDKLLEVGVKPEMIRCTGNMRLDPIVSNSNPVAKTELARKYDLDPDKKWILFAENRGGVYKLNEAACAEYEAQGVLPEDLKIKKDVGLKSMSMMFDQMRELPGEFFSEFEFIYRTHPGTTTPLKDSKHSVRVIPEEPVSAWLANVDFVLVWNSTVAFEAELAEVPVMRHEPIRNPERLIPLGFDKVPILESLSEIDARLIESQKAAQKDARNYERVYGVVDGKATERVAETLAELLQVGMPKENHIALSSQMSKLLLRKKIFEMVTGVVAKTGLLTVVKWPHSAYNQLNDIPGVKKS